MSFWTLVKWIAFAAYILSALGVIVMNFSLCHDLRRILKKEGFKFEPYSFSEKVASRIKLGISILLPVWNLLIFLTMVWKAEECLDRAIDELMDRRIFEEEGEDEE